MHEPVKVNVEDYLAGSDSVAQQVTGHLGECESCRRELAALQSQAALLRALRPPRDLDARPGFYARVIERIEGQRQGSIWSIFLEPAFGRRLAVASAAVAVLMGLYMVGSEPGGIRALNNPSDQTAVLGKVQAGPVLGLSQDQDRGAVFADFVTYRPEQ